MTRKKPVPIKMGRLAGGMITFGFIGAIVLLIAFGIFNNMAVQEQTEHKNTWRQMSCEDMKKDYELDQQSWKWLAIVDICYEGKK